MTETANGLRAQPMYTISEAARLAQVAPVTVRRWLRGYAPDPRYPEWRSPPVFGPKDAASSLVSYFQLIEIVIAADFRKISHLKLDIIRDAHAALRGARGVEYPFAHHRELESLGSHVVEFFEKGQAQAIDSPTQFSLPGLIEQRAHEVTERRVSEMDFEANWSARWYPVGRGFPVVVDPEFSAGSPTVVGRGVTVSAIYNRWRATDDDNIAFIADDFQLDVELVERVLKYADKIAA